MRKCQFIYLIMLVSVQMALCGKIPEQQASNQKAPLIIKNRQIAPGTIEVQADTPQNSSKEMGTHYQTEKSILCLIAGLAIGAGLGFSFGMGVSGYPGIGGFSL